METIRDMSPEFLKEDLLHIKLWMPPDFHLKGDEMVDFLVHLTEAGEMEIFERPRTLDEDNYYFSVDAVPHPLGGMKKPRDENGTVGWRDSWCHGCIYNSTRSEHGVQMTITAHSCGDFPTDKFLNYVYRSLQPAYMEVGSLSNEQAVGFHEYEPKGDKWSKEIVGMLNMFFTTEDEKVKAGRRLEELVLERERWKKTKLDLKGLDTLLLGHEMAKLQDIFGTMEGIFERKTANEIINSNSTGEADEALSNFPYYQRYTELTVAELAKTEAQELNNICMVGGGELPISAIMYAQNTDSNVFVVEQDKNRARVARKVVKALGLSERIKIINKKAERVDYRDMNVVFIAAMADPKNKILMRASKTAKNARSIVVRTPIGDTRAFYQGTYMEDLGPIWQIPNHTPRAGLDVHKIVDTDGVFCLIIFDHI